jgi:hypothetical protein
MVDAPPVAAALGKRKQQGQHVVPYASRCSCPSHSGQAGEAVEQQGVSPKKAASKKAAKMPPTAKMASLTSLTAAMVTAPPKPADACKVLDKSLAVDDAPKSYVDMLNDATDDIDSPPLADYDDYNDGLEQGLEGEEFEEEKDVGGEEEDELEEIEEGAFDGAVAKVKGRAIRSDNYSEFEDVILICAWEVVSMDVVAGTDQTGKRYW